MITALNEEAVAAAALGNKAGLNPDLSYEAFAVKMLGLLRQEIISRAGKRSLGQTPGWLPVPLIVTSHTWENSKNEQSHQDPTIAEALLGEMSDTARVLFPVDGNTAVAALRARHTPGAGNWPASWSPSATCPSASTQIVPRCAGARRCGAHRGRCLDSRHAIRRRRCVSAGRACRPMPFLNGMVLRPA